MTAFVSASLTHLLFGVVPDVSGFLSLACQPERSHGWKSTLADQDPKCDFSSFDYKMQWYPVSFVNDLPLKKVAKVTIFDTDYAVARISETEVIAMLDVCPHKMAALSQGRVTANGFLQCSYHGWVFNGTNGLCQQIPQASIITDGKLTSKSAQSGRTAGTAVPAMIVQSMVFLFPFGNLETALLAPPPPRLPDIREGKGWRMTPVVRDFPIDWPILVENIMDPDHGVFAHGAVGFDRYSASSDAPQRVTEMPLYGGTGWTITSSVDAKLKLLALSNEARGKLSNQKREETTKNATTTFVAPSLIYQCRRDTKTGESNFVLPFYVTPTGTGRSRFMSAAYYKLPFTIPRWIFHVNILNFLDQDTYLLATQQHKLLALEQKAMNDLINVKNDDTKRLSLQIRQKGYVFRSPTERMAARLSSFWDATLSRVPRRVETLRKLDLFAAVPPRSVVLDREIQHLDICPDSQSLVRNCNRIMRFSRGVLALTAAVKLLFRSSELPKRNIFSELSRQLTFKNLVIIWSVSSVTFWLARKLKREFYFKGNEKFHEKDLANIPSVWGDTF